MVLSLVAAFGFSMLALGIYALRTAHPDPFDEPEYTPETPVLPPAIVIHLSLGDRLNDREPWESQERAEKAWTN